MWVRVARFEGGTPEELDAEMARTKQHLADATTGGLPVVLEGVRRVLEAINRTEGTAVSMVFCETEEDLRKADQALNDMSPSSEASPRLSRCPC
jgi:hypothetical protein